MTLLLAGLLQEFGRIGVALPRIGNELLELRPVIRRDVAAKLGFGIGDLAGIVLL